MKEQDIQKKLIKKLEARGCYVVKVITANKAGVPDILACCNGKFIAIEVKRPNGVVSELQKAHLAMVEAAGGKATVAYSASDDLGLD
jgi:Holliday junction resolvase